MDLKKWVPILVAIIFIAFGVGIYSIRVNENFNTMDFIENKSFYVDSNNSKVQVGSDGIFVKDGKDEVHVSWKGIDVKDGNEHVVVDWDGVKVSDRKKFRFNNFFSLFKGGIFSNNWNLSEYKIDEDRFSPIDGISDIDIKSSFINIEILEEDRDDIKIKYYGWMKSNVLPELIVKNSNNSLLIHLETDTTGYSVSNSDVKLKVFVPKAYKGDFNIAGSSADIEIKELDARNFNITTSSGDIELENLKGDNFNVISSSGDMNLYKTLGPINIVTSSGDVELDLINNSSDINLRSSSGDFKIKFAADSSFKISGASSSGYITSQGAININKANNGKYNFTIGEGDNSINIETSSGDVQFIQP